MSNPYKLTETETGFSFSTDLGHQYSVLFSLNNLYDRALNAHAAFNINIERNGGFEHNLFIHEYDERVKATILDIITRFFLKNDNKALIYFCFNIDGHARKRNIVFGSWFRELSGIELVRRKFESDEGPVYTGLMVLKENPLKDLIIEAFMLSIDALSDPDKGEELSA